jgi:hypothetical protein
MPAGQFGATQCVLGWVCGGAIEAVRIADRCEALDVDPPPGMQLF